MSSSSTPCSPKPLQSPGQSFDFYAKYKAWYEKFYGRPFEVTREMWNSWCVAPSHPQSPQSDIDFDYQKERDGDAQ